MHHSAELPLCPICCEVLGKYGGPSTLPCGHNGCLHCLETVQSRSPQCPLCRAPFGAAAPLGVNHELRELVGLALALQMDEATQEEGWEAFPTARLATEHYAAEVKQERGAGGAAAGAAWLAAPGGSGGDGGGGVVPSAPAAAAALAAVAGGGGRRGRGRRGAAGGDGDQELLLLEPPRWLPDSFAMHCGACGQPFRALLRLRHHCRMCGKVFCHDCCHERMLLPPKYQQREPQRVCSMCCSLLQPLQPYLVGAVSPSVQPPVHDAHDAVSLRSWLNTPWSGGLADDIYKATNILHTFMQAARLEPERRLPSTVLEGARGLALFSIVKLGAGWSCTVGTGLVIARLRDGSWSAPCAAAAYGLGWGLQLGGELQDTLLVLRSEDSLAAFCSSAHLGLGGAAGVALGPLGRSAGASVRLGSGGGGGGATAVGYSCSRGAFAGVSLEGSVTCVRGGANHVFYGYPATARQLLLEGSVPQPPAAAMLYDALRSLMCKYEGRGRLVHRRDGVAAGAVRGGRSGERAGTHAGAEGRSRDGGALGGSPRRPSRGHEPALPTHEWQLDGWDVVADNARVVADSFATTPAADSEAARAPPLHASAMLAA